MRTVFLSLFVLLLSVFTNAENAVFTASKDGFLPGTETGAKITSLCRPYSQGGAKNSVKIIFDKPGDYHLTSSILVQCNVEIEGVKGVNFILEKDCAFLYTSYIVLFGTPEENISVKIRNISLTMPHHDEYWFEGQETQGISIYDANRVELSDVRIYYENAIGTCVDIRRCSNISVTDCDITNYNNCKVGGNLWIRGGAENVKIKNNTFRKYGNDEIIAMWTNPVEFELNRNGVFKNIEIANNKVYYGFEGKSKRKIAANVLFCFYNDNESNSVEMYRNSVNRFSNFSIHDNKIEVNDPVGQLFGFRFNEFTGYDNIRIFRNDIRYSDYTAEGVFYTAEFYIRNLSECRNRIEIKGNSVDGHDRIQNSYGEKIHYFVNTVNASLLLENNEVRSENGFFAFNTYDSGTDIEMRGNKFENLFKLGSVASQNPLKSFKLKATDNTFDGITHIYFRNLQHASLEFTGNSFLTGDYTFLLLEFAQNGTLKFTDNLVKSTRRNDKSVMYSKYTGNEVRYHFDSITVKNNIFRNVDLGTVRNAPASGKVVRNNLNL